MAVNNRRSAKSAKKKEYFRSGYAYLACQIAPTRFEGERVVYIDRLDGGRTVAITDPGEVEPKTRTDKIIPGEAVVRVVRRIEGGFIIDPPGEAVNSGGRIAVPENAVRFV